MRRRNEVVLWSVYFDSLKSRSAGRRLPRNLSVPLPNIEMLEKAIKNLGLKYEVFPEAAYSRLPWIKTGFIIMEKGEKRKNQILKDVAAELIKISKSSV
jgi:signal recognition particle subunit SEC65